MGLNSGVGSTVVWGNTDLVWDNPSIWSQTVVWGNAMIGTDGGSALGPTTVVWGTFPVTDSW